MGVANNCGVTIARRAYRRLAMLHHPDRGGSKENFQKIQLAWSKIEAGYTFTEPKPEYQSEFFNATGPQPRASPYPTYDKPVLTKAKKVGNKWTVSFTITQTQAFMGCNIPFICNGTLLEHWVSPGSEPYEATCNFKDNPMIGATPRIYEVRVQLYIVEDTKKQPDQSIPKDVKRTVQICALSLYAGGSITLNIQNRDVSFILEPGYNYDKPLVLLGQGEYGGNLILKMKPLFKNPTEFNQQELNELKRLQDIVNDL